MTLCISFFFRKRKQTLLQRKEEKEEEEQRGIAVIYFAHRWSEYLNVNEPDFSLIWRRMKRAKRNTNTRKKTKLHRWKKRKKRRRSPVPRKQTWMSWRTFWVEEQARSKEMMVIMKNSESFCHSEVEWAAEQQRWSVAWDCPGSLTSSSLKQHLQAIRNTHGFWRLRGQRTLDSGPCLFPLIDYPSALLLSLSFQPMRK